MAFLGVLARGMGPVMWWQTGTGALAMEWGWQ